MKRISTILSILLLFIFTTFAVAQSKVLERGGKKYLSGVVIAKFKDGAVNVSSPGKANIDNRVMELLKNYGFVEAVPKFKSSLQKVNSPLSNIVELRFKTTKDPLYIANKISRMKEIEWAEPHYVSSLNITPNDVSFGSQWYLKKINAEAAWDVTTGDTAVVVAILDSGFDMDHPDLAPKVWINKAEIPDNSIDDDNNGYVDDVRGYDLSDNDNNPDEPSPIHGSLIAGLAGAVTNNGEGIASIGYNIKLMNVKITSSLESDNLVTTGYEGIVYAVDNGAKVINCSWGNYVASSLGKTVVDYAAENNVLIVAASGNEGNSSVYYPAAFEKVLSVGSTDSTDIVSDFTNYGKSLDVVAPGRDILSTWKDDTYASNSGTSLASPIVAGLAGLVWSSFPNYTAAQVAEQIRVNVDDISSINSDKEYFYGLGRINAEKAVTETNAIAVRAINIVYEDLGNGNGVLETEEQAAISIDFTNYLSATSNLTITIETATTGITINNGSFSAGAKNSGEEFSNNSNKFTFTVGASTPINTEVEFLIKYTDGNYSDYQWTTVSANPQYATQDANNVSLTVTSDGQLAWDNYPFIDSGNDFGDSFRYKNGPRVLFEGGLLYGISSSKVMDAVHTSYGNAVSKDFKLVTPFTVSSPGSIADQEGYTKFNDEGGLSRKLSIDTELRTYSYTTPDHDDYIILEYEFHNNSGAVIADFYAGLFLDWDIHVDDWFNDVVEFDDVNNFGYVYDKNGTTPATPYVATVLLSEGTLGQYGFVNGPSPGKIDPTAELGFTDSDKWSALTNGLADVNSQGDIAQMVSAGPFQIDADGSQKVAFAMAAGMDYDEMLTAVQNARAKYLTVTDVEMEDENLPKEFSLAQNYPNPFNPTTMIGYELAENANVNLTVYDVLGNRITTLVDKIENAGAHSVAFDASKLTSGVYFYQIRANGFVNMKKMILVK
ncbi:MAG: S8 family serine peptidase [Melioribacteraceae bacterium]|nr:S8 family serine peptidase [Melioribacteraceae bacterium]